MGGAILAVHQNQTVDLSNLITLNHQYQTEFQELKSKYEQLLLDYEWNSLIYKSKFNFEPIVGQVYHLYKKENGDCDVFARYKTNNGFKLGAWISNQRSLEYMSLERKKLLDDLGMDINFNKHFCHGLEFRIFDSIPINDIKEILTLLVYLADFSEVAYCFSLFRIIANILGIPLK